MDINNIPIGMIDIPNWVLWRLEDRNGKPFKVPYCAHNIGRKASSTDKETWTDFETAVKALRSNPGFSGLGFVFSKEAGLIGIDLDHALVKETGECKERWVEKIVTDLGSYTEVSPSGEGLHIICKGTLPVKGCNDGKHNDVSIEMYAEGRYFTVTGDRLIDEFQEIVGEQRSIDKWYEFVGTRKASFEAKLPKPETSYTQENVMSSEAFVWDGNIEHLPIKEDLRNLILGGAPKGQRSEAIMSALNALVWSCLTDEQIRGVLDAYPIGEKYREHGKSRERWLEPQLAKARSIIIQRASAPKQKTRQTNEFIEDLPPIESYVEAGYLPETEFVNEEATHSEQKPEQAKRVLDCAWIQEFSDIDPDWVVPGYLNELSIGVVFGDPGSYKSFLAIDWACHVASGRPYLGHPTKQGVAVIIAGEGIVSLNKRIKAWCYHNEVDFGTLPVLAFKRAKILTDKEEVKGVIEDIKALTEGMDVRIVVVDTLSKSFGGDENDSRDMTAFLQSCDQIKSDIGASVVLVHHCGQADKSRSRGSSVLKGNIDCEYRVSKEDDGLCIVHCTKVKEGEQPHDLALSARSIDLGRVDTRGMPATSLVLVPVEGYQPTPKAIKKGGRHDEAVKILEDVIKRADEMRISHGYEARGCATLKDFRDALKTNGFPKQTASRELGNFVQKDGFVYLD